MNLKPIKRKLDRLPIITAVLTGINVLMFLITDLIPGVGSVFFEYGSLGYQNVIHQHQFYRLITHMFLHLDQDHIFSNILLLVMLGYYIEDYLGHTRFLILYFCCGFLAGCTSIVYNMIYMDPTTSLGASGAVFGLMGSYIYMIWRNQQGQQVMDIRRLAFVLVIIFYGGFSQGGIDNAAHVGGFLCGIPCVAILDLTRNRKGRKKR